MLPNFIAHKQRVQFVYALCRAGICTAVCMSVCVGMRRTSMCALEHSTGSIFRRPIRTRSALDNRSPRWIQVRNVQKSSMLFSMGGEARYFFFSFSFDFCRIIAFKVRSKTFEFQRFFSPGFLVEFNRARFIPSVDFRQSTGRVPVKTRTDRMPGERSTAVSAARTCTGRKNMLANI